MNENRVIRWLALAAAGLLALLGWQAGAATAAPISPEEAVQIVLQGLEPADVQAVTALQDQISQTGPANNTDTDAQSAAIAWNATDREYLVVWLGDAEAPDFYEIWGQIIDEQGANVGLPLQISTMNDDDSAVAFYGLPDVAWTSVSNQYLVVWSDDNGATNNEYEIWGRVLNNAGAEVTAELQLSQMGPASDPAYQGILPAVAYNATNNQYLVTWTGESTASGLVDNEFEIWGQLVAANGAEVGSDFRISTMGGTGDTLYRAQAPDVAWNNTNNQYLVVWYGDTTGGGFANEELEIWGQLVSGAGAEVGGDFRISSMGGTGDANDDALNPAVAYNSRQNEFVVVWEGDEAGTGGLVDNEFEIWGQRVSAAGTSLGSRGLVSRMNATGFANLSALRPAVTYNARDDRYLVVFEADTATGGLADDEFEIWFQHLAADLSQIGSNTRLSYTDVDNDPAFDALAPAVAWNSVSNQYQAVWEADTSVGGQVDGAFEIYGMRVEDALRISYQGFTDNTNGQIETAGRVDVAYSVDSDRYLVVWSGSDNAFPIGIGQPDIKVGEFEIWAQWLAGDGTRLGSPILISDATPQGGGSDDFAAFYPSVTWNLDDNQFFVVWMQDTNVGGVDDEYEIWGRRVQANNGEPVAGGSQQLTDFGSGGTSYQAQAPAVAYGFESDRYLVVFQGNTDQDAALNTLDTETWGLIVRRDGTPDPGVTTNPFRISDMTPNGGGNAGYNAFSPAVVWNTANEFMVVWAGDTTADGLVDNEVEIWGRRVGALGSLSTAQFRISTQGGTGNAAFDAERPSLAFDSVNGGYLVAWHGDTDAAPLVDNELEVWGQLMNVGTLLGENFRISGLPGDGNAALDSAYANVAFDPNIGQYLVTYAGQTTAGGLAANELEIYGQTVSAAGLPLGPAQRLTSMGPDGNGSFAASASAAVYNTARGEFFMAFVARTTAESLAASELEVWARAVAPLRYVFLPLVRR